MTELSYITYHEGVAIIEKAVKENEALLTSLDEYMIKLAQSIKTLSENISNLPIPTTKTPLKDTSFSANLNSFIVEVFSQADFGLCAVDYLTQGSQAIKSFLGSYVGTITEQLKKVKKDYSTFDQAVKLRASTYAAYQKAHSDVEQAFQAKSPKLNEVRLAFCHARDAAVQANQDFNKLLLSTSLSVEELYGCFQLCEANRVTLIRNICHDNIANALESLACKFETKSQEMIQNLKCNDPAKDNKRLVGNHIKDPLSDDRFQLIPVYTKTGLNITEYLDLLAIFKEEADQGAKLYAFTQDYDGKDNFLSGKANEVILGLKEEENRIFCRNINDSVGYVLKSMLKPVH